MLEIFPKGKNIVIKADLNKHLGQAAKEMKEFWKNLVSRYFRRANDDRLYKKNEFMCGKRLFPKERRTSKFLQK